MTATATTRAGRPGARVELARYTVGGVGRTLVGQRVNGVVRLMDIPVERGGRAYLVERGLEEEGAECKRRALGFDRGLLAAGAQVRRDPDAGQHPRLTPRCRSAASGDRRMTSRVRSHPDQNAVR